MNRSRQLACPNGCKDGRFELLNAPVIVDTSGRYLSHDDSAAAYTCVLCNSVAIDIAAAARQMRSSEGEGDSTTALTCPSCGTIMLPPDDDSFVSLVECPTCNAQFTMEEGMPRLFGSAVSDED